jgi:putative membrane protein
MAVLLAQMMDRGDMHDGGGGHWWWWLIGLGVLLALVAIVAVIVVNLTHQPSAPERSRTAPEAPRSSAEQVLADRLARGEIDADEYRQRRDALRE